MWKTWGWYENIHFFGEIFSKRVALFRKKRTKVSYNSPVVYFVRNSIANKSLITNIFLIRRFMQKGETILSRKLPCINATHTKPVQRRVKVSHGWIVAYTWFVCSDFVELIKKSIKQPKVGDYAEEQHESVQSGNEMITRFLLWNYRCTYYTMPTYGDHFIFCR